MKLRRFNLITLAIFFSLNASAQGQSNVKESDTANHVESIMVTGKKSNSAQQKSHITVAIVMPRQMSINIEGNF